MRRPSCVVTQGVYGGYCLICTYCKGLTYVPNRVDLDEYLAERAHTHVLWCPGAFEDVLAYFADRVKRDDGTAGPVGTEGK